MSSRPRIRTLKPEFWADEKVGHLSRDARLLLVGLITMADDEGRLRALPVGILGHVFPYDADAIRKLEGWLAEVIESGIVLPYMMDGTPYLAFRHWKRHQKISKASTSLLPKPPSPVIVADNSVIVPGSVHESSRNVPGIVREESGRSSSLSRAGADRNGSRIRNGTDLQQGGAQYEPPFEERSSWGDETVAHATELGDE